GYVRSRRRRIGAFVAIDRFLEKGLKRAGQSAAKQSAQPFGQVSTTRHMDTNRDDVKHCNSMLPVFILARLGVRLARFWPQARRRMKSALPWSTTPPARLFTSRGGLGKR